ncbi:MAG: phospholipid carrier-dependent glycosyltransferase [Candidatus Limnocylindrales bacterium]
MTATPVGGVGRSPGEPVRPLSVLALSPAIIALLLAGLALRLLVAYVLFPGSGFESDLSTYAAWAASMAEHGPWGFYANTGFADYPPAYLYALWLVGSLSGSAVDATELIKLPPILLDLVVGYVIFRLVRGWAWPGTRSERLALAAAALYVFNPVSFYDSALWGQTDAAGALVVLLGVAALVRGNSEGAAALAATAALVKPQFGVVLIPIVAAVLLKRHLLRSGSGPRNAPWAPSRLAGWLRSRQGPIRLLTAFVAAWAAFLVIALPFGMGPLEYLERMFGTAGGYGYLSVNAYNLWALVGAGGEPSLAEALRWSDDTVGLIGPIPGVAIGAALLVFGFLWGVARGAIRDDRWTLIAAVTFLAIAFFILPTRVHERYIFPAVALMPLLAVVSGRWAVALLLLSVGAFINLHGILTLPLYGSANVEELPLGELFRTEPLIVLSALLQTGVGLWVAAQLRPTLRTSPDGFDDEAARRAWSVPAALPGDSRPRVPPDLPGSYPGLPPAPPEPDRPAGLADLLAARLSWGSLRRDRSALLRFELGGRIERLDLLVLLVLVVLTLTLRGYRLDQPVRMYFDEVYHARTATEFLQHWEYGEPHDIYEFTHPHLAKYAMAWGIRLAGGNGVTGEADLGMPVSDAVIEPRWAPDDGDRRNGDRLYVAAGDRLGVYDLATRELVAELPVEAQAVAVDENDHALFVADPAGRLYRFETSWFDAQRFGAAADPAALAAAATPFSFGPGAPVQHLLVTDTAVVAVTLGSVVSFDRDSGEQLSERLAVGIAAAVELPWVERLVIDTRALSDREATATLLADLLGRDREALAGVLDRDGFVTVAAWLDSETVDLVLEQIEGGALAGASFESAPLLAVGDSRGIEVLDVWSLDLLEEVPTGEPVVDLALAGPESDEPTLYASAGSSLVTLRLDEDGPAIPETVWMPGAVGTMAWNGSAELMHVLGLEPGGQPTVYVVEPKGRSVFIDVPLAFQPERLLADTQAGRPDADRTELLAMAADGTVAGIDIGSNAVGWRLPGVLLGALTAALVFLLARVLFARRSIGLIAAALVVAEGMLFANARIAMNDVYVTAFILLAVLLLAPLYLAPRRPWTAAALVVGAGAALGLALASKWVALYAIGGLGLLVLFRSALGRAMALLGMLGLTTVLGTMAIQPDAGPDVTRNWVFLALTLVLTGLLAAAVIRRPIPWTRVEVILAVAMPLAAGVALFLLRMPALGGLAMMLSVAVAVLALTAAMVGHGPFASGAPAPPSGTSAWLRPGPVHVLPWLLTLAALTVLPLAVYIVTYSPWVELGNDWGVPLLGSLPFLAEGSEGGRTLFGLTESMYQYHDNLRAEHAASSPWWAWPLDLKPVWFFQERYDEGATGLIYDTGNLVIFWLGIAGMGFSAWMAWRRRSLALTMVVVMWAAMWLPWARVDRAAFQYHVYASLPFMVTALAYFLAELWHGPTWRTWFLARAAAALAILAIPLMWLLRTPLCIIAGTAEAHPNGVACAGEVTRTAQLSEGGVTALFVLAAGAAMVGFLGWRAARADPDGRGGPWLAALVSVALATLVGVVAALAFLETGSTTGLALSSDVLAIMGLVVLAVPAVIVLRARDPRRFVLGVLIAAGLWLLLWYPNISGLPLPDELAHLYQGLLPTWNYDFQFAVNTDPASDSGIIQSGLLLVGGVSLVFVAAVALVARRWAGRGAGS